MKEKESMILEVKDNFSHKILEIIKLKDKIILKIKHYFSWGFVFIFILVQNVKASHAMKLIRSDEKFAEVKIKRIFALSVIAFSLVLFVPIVKAVDPIETLYADGLTSGNTINNPTNANGAADGSTATVTDFDSNGEYAEATIENSSQSGIFNSLNFSIRLKFPSGNDKFDIQYWDSGDSTWYTVATGVGAGTSSLTWFGNYSATNIGSWSEVDAFKVRIVCDKVAGPDNADLDIDAFHVHADYSPYGWLNVSLLTPSDNSDWVQNETYWVNATVTCEGATGAVCGTVQGGARYNGSSVRTYDFTGIANPSSTHNATFGTDTSNPCGGLTCDAETEFDDAYAGGFGGDYSEIVADDGTEASYNSEVDYSLHKFKFVIEEDENSITELNISWKGYGNADNGVGVNLSVWNSTDWQEVGSHTSASSDWINKSYTDTMNITNFIDANGYLYLLAETTYTYIVSEATIYTDYVKVVINSTAAKPNTLINTTEGAKPFYVIVSTYEASTYNFSGIVNPSSTHNATFGYDSARPCGALACASETEFDDAYAGGSGGNYSDIVAAEGTTASYVSSTEGNYPIHKFKFVIDEDENDIAELNISWRGRGYYYDENFFDDGYGVYLYVWNSTDWQLVGSHFVWPLTWINASYTDSTNITNFIDANGYLYLLAEEIYPYTSGTYSSPTIYTDYVKVDITAPAENPKSCGDMNQGDSCQLNWTANVTGNIGECYEIDSNFTSSYGNSNVPDNNTADSTVCIVSGVVTDTSFRIEMPTSPFPTNYSSSETSPGTATAAINFTFTSVPESDRRPCIAGNLTCQEDGIPIFNFYNVGNVDQDWWIRFNETLTGVTLKFSLNFTGEKITFSTSWFKVNGPTSIAQGTNQSLYLWADIASGTSPMTDVKREVRHNSTAA